VVVSSDSFNALASHADAYVKFCASITDADRETRMRLKGSPLEDQWSEVLATFAVGAPESATLLLMILERAPTGQIPEDVGQILVDLWLSSEGSKDAREWLAANESTNSNLKLALTGVARWQPDAW
jgi:hypothetical protein